MWDRTFRQVVPRPPWARAGNPAPWSGPASGFAGPFPIAAVRAQLIESVESVESVGPIGATADRAPTAAVLLALYESCGDTQLLLIRRSLQMARNPGEIAFPGGRIDPGETPLNAALREADEEIGLAPEFVEVIGHLSRIERPRAPAAILPYVGLLQEPPQLSPNAGEVDEVITVPVLGLLADGVYWEELWNPMGIGPIVMPFFSDEAILGDDLIWGASARMLTDLLTRVAPAVREAG
jgi:8-oxo-dGTP pyrophosphatase MutT (NUDIX family)